MKKKALLAAVAAAFVLTTASNVFANPVELSGKFETQYRYNTSTEDGVDSNKDGFKSTFVLDAKTNVFQNVDLYARFAAQHATIGADFFTGGKDTGAIDQFGFVVKGGNGFSYKIGRQDVSIGSTAIFYNSSPYLGRDAFADGITVTGKSGVTDLKVVALKEDRDDSDARNKIYALSASYSPAKNWTVGGTVGKYDYADAANEDTTHYAINVGYDHGKASYFTELGKSDADDLNKAVVLGVSYAPDAKNSFYVIYNKVEDNADMNGWTDFEPGQKSMYYGFNHKVTKDATLKFFYKDNKDVEVSSEKQTSFRTTLSVKF